MCDTFVVVGPQHVLFAKNSDRDPNEPQVLSWVAAADHPADADLRCTWRSIAQVAHTHAMVLSRPYWMWGAEMGVNEHGVAIGNEAIFTDAPHAEDGLLGMDLVRLGLERASSAVAAVAIISSLIERYGQGGRAGYANAGFRYHNSFLIADRREAWVLEAAGADIATEQVRSGVRAISNAITIPALLPRSRRAHALIAGSSSRRSRAECLAQGVRSAADAAAVLGDHGEGRSVPRFSWINGAMNAPCVHAGGLIAASQTTGSWISELAVEGDRHWATGSAAPCLSLFRPIVFDDPGNVGQPTGSIDVHSLWWRHEVLHRRAMRDPLLHAAMLAERSPVQQRIFAHPQDGWALAEQWLTECEQIAEKSTPTLAPRPRWLQGFWGRVDRQAGEAALLPWRDA